MALDTRLLPVVLPVMIASALFPLTNVNGDSQNPGIYEVKSSPFGISYEEWVAKWWQWTMSIPVSEHPRDAYTEEKCGLKQEGSVWYLPDKLGGREERTCTVPAGKAILIPVLTGECDYGIPEVRDDEDLRRCAMAGNEYGMIDVTINGVKIKNLQSYRAQSGFFNISIPADNIYEAPAGNFRAMADGFFVFLEPLPHGRHDVHLKASVLNPVDNNYNFEADWTYHLLIKPSN